MAKAKSSKAKPKDEGDIHRTFGVDLFNRVWELLEKEDRTPEEVDEMIHAAHASRYHWSKVGTPDNLRIGEWQVSRVYAALGRGEPAMFHAEKALAIAKESGVTGFHLASCYEGMARALSAAGRTEECRTYIEMSRQEGGKVEEKEDRDLLFNQLREIPEYWED